MGGGAEFLDSQASGVISECDLASPGQSCLRGAARVERSEREKERAQSDGESAPCLSGPQGLMA